MALLFAESFNLVLTALLLLEKTLKEDVIIDFAAEEVESQNQEKNTNGIYFGCLDRNYPQFPTFLMGSFIILYRKQKVLW